MTSQAWLLGFLFFLSSGSLWGQALPEDDRELPGGLALGLGLGGTAALSEASSVRSNPAMLAFEKNYTLGAGYHWPSLGREFYEFSVVDSRTSTWSAGIVYRADRIQENKEDKSGHKSRLSMALAHSFSKMAVGLGGQVLTPLVSWLPKKYTLGLGCAGLLTPTLRVGGGVENLQGGHETPRTWRWGLAYMLFNGDVTLHVDALQREKFYQEWAPKNSMDIFLPPDPEELLFLETPERFLVSSFTARFQELLRLMGSYGQNFRQTRHLASLGLALINQNASLSYGLYCPSVGKARWHQSFHVGVQWFL